MYYWKTKSLATEIKNENINKTETKNYYTAVSVITIVSMYLTTDEGTTSGIATLLECTLLIFITIFGINITFNTNQGNKGKDYISRVTMLSLPILIKLIVFLLITGFSFGYFMAANNYEVLPLVDTWLGVTISALLQIIYFWRINIYLQCINT